MYVCYKELRHIEVCIIYYNIQSSIFRLQFPFLRRFAKLGNLCHICPISSPSREFHKFCIRDLYQCMSR